MNATRLISQAQDLNFSELIRQDDVVVCGQAMGEPITLTRQLICEAAALPTWRIFMGATYSDNFAEVPESAASFVSYGAIGNLRKLSRQGRLKVLPHNYSSLPGLFDSDVLPAHVVLDQLGRSGSNGRLNLGANNDYVVNARRGLSLPNCVRSCRSLNAPDCPGDRVSMSSLRTTSRRRHRNGGTYCQQSRGVCGGRSKFAAGSRPPAAGRRAGAAMSSESGSGPHSETGSWNLQALDRRLLSPCVSLICG